MNFSRCRRKRALTLVEVIVGLVLMATLLASSLLAFGAHRRQRRTADNKLVAVAMADDLLNQLINTREGIPPSAQGALAGRPNWYWQTRVVGVTQPAGVQLQVVRLQIFSAETTQSLATVEVVRTIR